MRTRSCRSCDLWAQPNMSFLRRSNIRIYRSSPLTHNFINRKSVNRAMFGNPYGYCPTPSHTSQSNL